MSSGPKKRKATKRKHHKTGGDNHQQQQQDSPTSPNPSSLPPLIQPQGNGREKRPVAIEDEYEETFETPRFQPEMPYYSTENMKMGRIDEIEIPSGVNADPVGENSTGLDLEIPLNDEESSEEMKLEESENSNASEDDEGLKVTKLEESENSNASNDGEGVKEVKLDESVGVTEEELSTEKGLALEKSEIEDQSVAVVDEVRTPDASIRLVDVSSSNEKEVKVVPWLDEEISAVNGAVIGDLEVVLSEKGGDGDGNGDRVVESELQKDYGLEETSSENLGAEKEQPIPVTENSKYVAESVRETLPQVDVDLISNKLDKSVEKGSLTIESSHLITEDATQGSKAPHENLESVVGATRALSHVRVKEATNCSLDKVEIAQRKEVARGPVLTRHATIWNCCGLLEVIANSNR